MVIAPPSFLSQSIALCLQIKSTKITSAKDWNLLETQNLPNEDNFLEKPRQDKVTRHIRRRQKCSQSSKAKWKVLNLNIIANKIHTDERKQNELPL